MIEFTLRHPLDCTPARHWEMFFDPEWTRTLIIDGLGFRTCDVQPVRQEGTTRLRDMSVTPKIDVPGPVARLLGDKLGYTEKGKYDETAQRWTYQLVLNVLTEKIRMGGEVTLEPLGTERCTRVSKMWVDVKIFGLGGMVEKAAEKNMRDGWNRSAEWINGWLGDHPTVDQS
ncbi:MAG: DUF2505 family protein [Myxococcales bacterium]|nr:DUF2505 family protein [Myxococcales bacterium]